MKRKTTMFDFLRGECAAIADSDKFIDNWFDTKMNHCSVCGEDKSKCNFYKELVAKETIDEKDFPP